MKAEALVYLQHFRLDLQGSHGDLEMIVGALGRSVAEVFIELETERGEPAGRHLNRHGHIQTVQKHQQAVSRSEQVDVSERVDRPG